MRCARPRGGAGAGPLQTIRLGGVSPDRLLLIVPARVPVASCQPGSASPPLRGPGQSGLTRGALGMPPLSLWLIALSLASQVGELGTPGSQPSAMRCGWLR